MKLGDMARFAKGEMWLTPRYEAYITGNRSVAAERDALVEIMTRPKRVRTQTFSASGAGQCPRRRQLAYLGIPQKRIDPKSANIFANGDFMHLRHQVAGIISGYLIAAEHFVTNEDWGLTGTLDGVTIEGDIAEFKSINERGFSKVMSYGVQRNHEEQVHSYMLLTGMKTAWVLYENKNTQETKEFRVDQDPFLMDKVKRDLSALREATDDKVLFPVLDEYGTNKGECRWCPFQKVCPSVERFESPRRRIRVAATSSSPELS